MIYQVFNKPSSIYYKYGIIQFADEIGVDLLFERSENFFVKSRATLNAWRKEIANTALPMPKLKTLAAVSDFSFVEPSLTACLEAVRRNLLLPNRSAAELSNHMRPIFERFLLGQKPNKAERLTLISNQLITHAGDLSPLGEVYRVSKLPLSQQCTLLDLPVRTLELFVSEESIEQTVCDHLASTTPLHWYYLENNFFSFVVELFLKPLRPPPLAHVSVGAYGLKHDGDDALVIDGFSEQYFDNVARAIEVNQTRFQDTRGRGFSDVSPEKLATLCRAIGYERFRSIIVAHRSDFPFVRSRGWPDLIGVSDGQVRFVEVKRGERLTISQVENFPFIRTLEIPLEIMLVKSLTPVRSSSRYG